MRVVTTLPLPEGPAPALAQVRSRPLSRLLGWPLAFAAVLALHAVFLVYFAPPATLFSGAPVFSPDYALHYYQVDRAVQAFEAHGTLWSYDPQVLAGQPANVLEDLTSKGTELFVVGLVALGVPQATAFNAFVLLVMASVPFLGFAAGRLWGLDRKAAVIAAFLWVALWWFDSMLHWSWWVGMISWVAASLLAVVLAGLLYRTLSARWRPGYALLALTAAALTLIHPFAVLSVLVPCAVLYGRAFRRLRWFEHALLIGAALLAGSTALVWAGPALRFRAYGQDADTFFNATLSYVVTDFLDLVQNARNTGAPVRTVVRTLCFVLGVVALVRWARRRDPRASALIASLAFALLVAYAGAYTWLGRQTQPYRQIVPAMLTAALPAAALLGELSESLRWKRLGQGARLALVVALALVAPRVARTVLYFAPTLLPQAPAPLGDLRDIQPVSALNGTAEAPPRWFGLAPPRPEYPKLAAWLEKRVQGKGRVLVYEWMFAEYLGSHTNLPVLGGFPERNAAHVDANLFRRDPGGELSGPALSEYLERYAVGWLVASGPPMPLESSPAVEHLITFGDFRLYRTRTSPSYFAEGSGRLVDTALNSIRIADARAGQNASLTLRFHWLESLRCRPDCELERAELEGDRVGFIRVPNPPPAFEIYNGY